MGKAQSGDLMKLSRATISAAFLLRECCPVLLDSLKSVDTTLCLDLYRTMAFFHSSD